MTIEREEAGESLSNEIPVTYIVAACFRAACFRVIPQCFGSDDIPRYRQKCLSTPSTLSTYALKSQEQVLQSLQHFVGICCTRYTQFVWLRHRLNEGTVVLPVTVVSRFKLRGTEKCKQLQVEASLRGIL